MTDSARADRIVQVLSEAFSDLMDADPDAFRRKFRKMAADPFAFYRGSACLFYADASDDAQRWGEDPWADDRTSRVWIQGDLHAENFGTYMDGEGVLVFDVNDFDEAYLGHFTWDLRRFAASLALLGWTKALPDDAIARLVSAYASAYLRQVRYYVESDHDHGWSLRLGTAEGPVRGALLEAQLSTRVALLDRDTVVEEYQRRFRHGPFVRVLEEEEREAVRAAYDEYLRTIPRSKRLGSLTYQLKDVVGRFGFGIGSAGLPAYNLLVEGHTQALENDVVLSMKMGGVAAPSRVVDHRGARETFQHDGHRTAVSQRALQAHADPWLGWCRVGDVGFVVKELSPYENDLDWSDLTEPDDIEPVVEQLGRATAKVHCVSDLDTEETPLVEFQVEDAVAHVVDGREDGFCRDLVDFGAAYAGQAREDHRLFVDAFRAGAFEAVAPSRSGGRPRPGGR